MTSEGGEKMPKRVLILAVSALAILLTGMANAADISFPGSIWSEIKTQASPMNSYGAIMEGVIEQGAELSDDSFGKLKFNFFGELRYSFSPNGPWYNYAAPGIGARLEYPGQNGFFRLGVKISQETWQGHDSNTAAVGFITIYRGWNLLKH